MTFEELDYFIAAVEADTFFDAAEKLHITQSTLSKHIKKLEKELNILLFNRNKRAAALTDAGKLFYEEALSLSSSYHHVLEKMKAFQKPSSSAKATLHIGALPLLTQYNLAAPIHDFIKKHPELTVSLAEAEEPELMTGLKEGTFDIIFARETMMDTSSPSDTGTPHSQPVAFGSIHSNNPYTFCPLAKDHLSVMLPAHHPLADRPSLSLLDIAEEDFILMHPYTAIYQLCQNLFYATGITPNILRTARMESIISAVRFGEGISLFPESNFHAFSHEGLVAIPLMDAPELVVGMAYQTQKIQETKQCGDETCPKKNVTYQKEKERQNVAALDCFVAYMLSQNTVVSD